MKNYLLSCAVALVGFSSISAFAVTENVSVAVSPASPGAATQPVTNWREDYAYSLGIQAYLFGMPFAYFQQLRHKYPWVKPTEEAHTPYNQYWHQRAFTSAEAKDGGTPNTNLFYSVASFDVSREPVILSVPAIADRYYTHELISMDSDNFAYVGTRATGTKAGHYAIVSPTWKGKLPKGVTALPPSRTPYGLIYGRTWINSPDDLPNVIAIQNQYKLTPLSIWGKPGAKAPVLETPWKPLDVKEDPINEWKNINRALTDNPPSSRYAAMMGQFAHIGVGPGQDVSAVHEDTKRGLLRAAKDGRALVRKSFGKMGKRAGSWAYPPATVGRTTLVDDYMLRATTALIGNGINDPEESVYNTNIVDSQERKLNSANRYTMTFTPETMPKTDPRGYWSLTLYGMDNDLVPNPISRYTFANKPAGAFKANADGSVTFHIQTHSPGADKESNWLPAPADNQLFYLILRSYLPGKEILEQTYVPPSVVRVD